MSRKAWTTPVVTRGDAPSRAFVITGFHRSGTSLAAAYLARAGLFIGHRLKQGELLPTGTWSGHHEDQEITALQANAMRARGLDLFPTDQARLPMTFTEPEKTVVRRLISERSTRPTWGFKDPRTCLFLDEWDRLLEHATYLFLLRRPAQAVASLVRRGRDHHVAADPAIGVRAWLVYNREVQRFVARHPSRTLTVALEDLLDAPERLIQRLNDDYAAGLSSVPLSDVFDARFLHRDPDSVNHAVQAQAPDALEAAEALHRALRAP